MVFSNVIAFIVVGCFFSIISKLTKTKKNEQDMHATDTTILAASQK
jgi:hypothetical protein